MKKSIYNILKECSQPRSKQERVELLQQNGSPVIQNLLKYAFDPNIEFDLPEGKPPYKPSDYLDQEGRLYTEVRRLYLFTKGGNPNLNKLKREMLFIQLIESIDKNDAELICCIKDKKLPFKSLTSEIVQKAFPGLY